MPPPALTAADKRAIRETHKRHLALQSALIALDDELLAMMDRRDELVRDIAELSPMAQARAHGVSQQVILTTIRPRRDYAHS